MRKYSIALFVLCTLWSQCSPYPDGAPETVCQTMKPFHSGGIPPQTTLPPYRIDLSSSIIGQGQTMKVSIIGMPAELQFEGFIIQARNINNPNEIIGSFNPSNEKAKLMNCFTGVRNSVTHSDTSKKVNFNLEWTAPGNFQGEVYFNATVAQKYDKYWLGILSQKIQVVPSSESSQLPAGSSTVSPISTTVTNFVPVSKPNPEAVDPIYNGCGNNKVCFGFPDNCISSTTCKIVAAILVRGDIYEIELLSTYENAAYVALGFSDDNKMGDDLVTECVPERGQVSVYSSFTSVPNYGTARSVVPQKSAKIIESSAQNGQIYCKVQRTPVTVVNGMTFDLTNKKYNLLLAAGTGLKENGAGYHDLGRIASDNAINLAVVQNLAGASNLLLRLHGAFMIVAWIGTTSVGILIARYFKGTWVGSQICGKDQWFAWHRMCMVTTWSLTVVAFILIFVELKAWSGEQNPHALLGTITTIICFIQPIGALFRPAPNAASRPLFNWMHWLGGNVAHILAIVTIFFAVKLTKAQLPPWFDWILVGFVVYHVIIHLVFSTASCLSEKKTNERISSFEMNDRSNGRNVGKSSAKKNASYASFRKGLLGAYVFILLLFVIALVCIVVLAPIEDTFKTLKSKVMN